MNLTEKYEEQSLHRVLIWVHITDGFVRDVVTLFNTTLENAKKKVYEYWESSNETFDINDDDDQIWDAYEQMLWSHGHEAEAELEDENDNVRMIDLVGEIPPIDETSLTSPW